MDKKKLHKNNYPEPDVPVEEAWNNMKQLLSPVPAAPAARSRFRMGNGKVLNQFMMGAGAVTMVAVITYVVAIKKAPSTSSKNPDNSKNIPRVDTVHEGTRVDYANKLFEFRNTPFIEVAGFIEKAYGVKIIVKNKLLHNCTITTRFDNKSLEEILDILGYTLGFEYKIDKKTNQVIISGDGCN